MTQMSLPSIVPRDRGKLNALRNILAAISDELRRQAPVAQAIVDYTTRGFSSLVNATGEYELLSSHQVNPRSISPYPFGIQDLTTGDARPEVFPNLAELINQLDLETASNLLNDVELIGIDESQIDTPLPQSVLTFLKSIAFRMYRQPDGTADEAAGPILSELRMQLRDDAAFENENKLLGYIRNNYIAYFSALTSLNSNRKPFIVIHGPLVRAIGGFSHISFDYSTANEMMNINTGEAGEIDIPIENVTVLQGDASTEHNISFNPTEVIDGKDNLRKFCEFCLFQCGRQCANVQGFPTRAIPPAQAHVTDRMVEERDYPGFCLYFWGLRSMFDLARLGEFVLLSVVEDISAATEFTRLVLPSLLSNPNTLRQTTQILGPALAATQIDLSSVQNQRPDFYRRTNQMIERLRLSDSTLFTYSLNEGQYTNPVQIYRYRTRNTFQATTANPGWGIRNEFEPILSALFPDNTDNSQHPGYRVVMSYLRTTPLREPIRVEFFDLQHLPHAELLGSTFLLSIPYQEYGIPVILYYADKLARTPSRLIRTIIEREYMDLVLENRFSDPVSIMQALGRLTRNYFQREGL